MYCYVGCQELLRNAVTMVVTDEGFSLPTLPAMNARTCAHQLLQWISSDRMASSTAAKSIVDSLERCFHESKSLHVVREKLWSNYYKLRSSDQFRDAWTEMMKNIDYAACPIFYQFVTDKMMESLISEHYRLESESPLATVAPLDYEDISALRYTAGYVFRALQKKVEKTAHPLKKEIHLCLMELMEDHGNK